MNNEELPEPARSSEERARDRSTPFPFIPLAKAIERASVFEAHYKRSAGRIVNVLPLWEYAVKSSGGQQTIGALRQFGLIEDEGTGADRKIKLTELAMRILKDERPGRRMDAIRESALKPKVIAERWRAWGFERPPTAECISELTLELGFTSEGAPRFLKVYDETISHANLANRDSEGEETSEASGASKSATPVFKVGDLVQWEPGGVLQFAEPKRVTGVSPTGEYVFVEGSSTGLSAADVKPAQVLGLGEIQAQPSIVSGSGDAKVMRQDTFSLEEGSVVLYYPSKMSPGSFEDFESWIQLQLKKIKRSVTSS